MILHTTPCLTASLLTSDNLLLEWCGRLQLPTVREAGTGLLQLGAWFNCQNLLLSFEDVTGADRGVVEWLGTELLPALRPAGQVALVQGLGLPTLLLAQQLAGYVAPMHIAGLFSDKGHAASWLHATSQPGQAATASSRRRIPTSRCVVGYTCRLATAVCRSRSRGRSPMLCTPAIPGVRCRLRHSFFWVHKP